MPNWVFTSMTVTGEVTDLRKFMEKASKPYTTYHKGKMVAGVGYDPDVINEQTFEGVISFMNFTSPEDVDAYFGASEYKPEGYAEMSMEERMAHAMKFSSDGWYDWNVRNWGTKWDACDACMSNEDPTTGAIGYQFSTAWSPAEGAFRQMVEQHPELGFEFYNEEEQGWGVEYVGEDGELSTVKEWDIPNSHKDWTDLGQDCRGCSYFDGSDDMDDLYEDCPDNKKATEQAVELFEMISDTI
jgi:hypothetical protein